MPITPETDDERVANNIMGRVFKEALEEYTLSYGKEKAIIMLNRLLGKPTR